MKELKRKTFLTILGILTGILIVSLAMINLQNYNREREGILRNLRMLDERNMPGRGPGVLSFDMPVDGGTETAEDEKDGSSRGFGPDPGSIEKSDIKDIMIMDHEVYTVFLKSGEIDRIISHGNVSGDFDIESISRDIINNADGDREYIGNLFLTGYSYRYRKEETIVVINHDEITVKLRRLLAVSLLLFLVFEAALAFLSRLITLWIISPAVEAFKKQKEFVADASHELKTPLAVIMASSDELENKDSSEETRRICIENIRYESDRMNRLILGLLELSRLENTDRRTSYAREDLSRLIEKTALVFEGIAFEQGVAIETDIKEGIVFLCSKDEMEKMLSVIIDNAVKHSYKGSAVKVSAQKEKGRIRIRITNQGDPIPAEDRDRIFERFYRADKARNRDENRYGLGLAIAKEIARNHNGDIRVYCENGKTTFEITLSD